METAIDEILRKDPKTSQIFLGCLARDELPKNIYYPCCFVLNTKPRSHPGQHWLAFYFDSKGFCEFFDSYGKNPKEYNLDMYLYEQANGWNYNKKQIQGLSPYCGHYAVLFLLFRARNKANIFFDKFSQNYSLNDLLIRKLLEEF